MALDLIWGNSSSAKLRIEHLEAQVADLRKQNTEWARACEIQREALWLVEAWLSAHPEGAVMRAQVRRLLGWPPGGPPPPPAEE
jgi:hypothetical protein